MWAWTMLRSLLGRGTSESVVFEGLLGNVKSSFELYLEHKPPREASGVTFWIVVGQRAIRSEVVVYR